MNQIDRLQPLANLGLVSAMIAHEMNNILTPLGSYAQLAMRHPDDSELAKKTIEKTARNSERAGKVIQSMLKMAKGGKQDKKRHILKAVLDEVFTLISRDFSKDRINVTVDVGSDLEVFVDEICFQQVLMNLILNARDAIISADRNPGILEIKAFGADEDVVIEISDNGNGIETSDPGEIFEAFYSTKSAEEDSDAADQDQSGTGLGLAFCKKVIDSHGGTITFESDGENGTTFRITLGGEE